MFRIGIKINPVCNIYVYISIEVYVSTYNLELVSQSDNIQYNLSFEGCFIVTTLLKCAFHNRFFYYEIQQLLQQQYIASTQSPSSPSSSSKNLKQPSSAPTN